MFPVVYSCDVRLWGYDQLLFLMDHTQLSRWTALIKQITEKFIIFFFSPGDGLEKLVSAALPGDMFLEIARANDFR